MAVRCVASETRRCVPGRRGRLGTTKLLASSPTKPTIKLVNQTTIGISLCGPIDLPHSNPTTQNVHFLIITFDTLAFYPHLPHPLRLIRHVHTPLAPPTLDENQSKPNERKKKTPSHQAFHSLSAQHRDPVPIACVHIQSFSLPRRVVWILGSLSASPMHKWKKAIGPELEVVRREELTIEGDHTRQLGHNTHGAQGALPGERLHGLGSSTEQVVAYEGMRRPEQHHPVDLESQRIPI